MPLISVQDQAAILGEVLRIRPQTWPNLRILEFGDRLLARNGELAKAAFNIYRHQLERRPHLAESMIQAGRWREVEAGRQAGLRESATAWPLEGGRGVGAAVQRG